MRAHLVQFEIAWENKPENYRRVRSLLETTRVAAGDLVLLPEMFDTGFCFDIKSTADTDGGTLAFLAGLARDLGATVQGARTLIGPDGKGRNMATVIGPDGALLVEYAKVHPFSFGRETEYFAGGDTVVTYTWTHPAPGSVGDAGSTTVCPAICYDLRFPELFRLGMLAGAEVFAIGANWPAPRAAHRRALLIARAIENQAYVLGVNRVGKDPTLAYAGDTVAIDPKGQVIAELADQAGVLTVDLDLGALRDWRKTFPAWRDVRLIQRNNLG